ncbi:MAG: M48 family metalloprotease [Anaerolineae bacterium]|nr:M48 family metalloprotease [Anaerolineae bacterium]
MSYSRPRTSYRGGGSGGLGIRLIIGLVLAVIAVISFLGSRQFNPVTGEDQYISLTPQQEIALGLQAVPEMMQEFGGEYRDPQLQQAVDDIGERLISGTSAVAATPWQFEFTVLNNPNIVNAFALPGGQMFLTTALINAVETEDRIAGVMAHEIVHVLARHSAQQIAKSELTNGLVGAVAVASESAGAAQTAAMIGQMVNMSYGREDELQSDSLGVCLLINAGYDPQAMIEVQQILARLSGSGGGPEWLSTHPSSDNRIREIQEAVTNAAQFCPQ